MKRCLFVLLAMLMLVLPASLVFAAETDLVLTFSEPVFNNDGTVSVDLVIENNPGFYFLGIMLDYDHDALTLAKVTEDTALGLTQGVQLIFNMSGNDNYTANGTLATLTFALGENVPHADFGIEIIYFDCNNADFENIAVEHEAGKVSIPHDLVHVDAVAPACHYNGNVEYWYCADEACGMVWTDEELTQLSNRKSVILPATGSDLLVHMEAVEPGCHYIGNIEHWICYECEQVWTDEALTQLTNSKNVILPELGGNVIHVEAIAPSCGVNGNNEYWHCEECKQVWADEARTQLTNRMNVIVPALEHEFDAEGICSLCGEESDLFISVDVNANTAYFNETFTVDILLDRNNGLVFLSLDVLFDADAFELVDVSNGAIIENFASGAHLVWASAENVTKTGVLATLTFKVKSDAAADSYSISLACNEAWNASDLAATIAIASGDIKVMMYGDVNGDSKIDGKDSTRLLQYLANLNPFTGESTVEVTLGADVNGDSKIDGKDSTRLLQYLANLNPFTGESNITLGPSK